MPKARKKIGLSKECIEKNLDEIIAISKKEGIEIDPLTISCRQTVYECPYKGCSLEFKGSSLLYHLKSHGAASQGTGYLNCPLCNLRLAGVLLIGHLENKHPESDVQEELRMVKTEVDPVHMAVRESVRAKEPSTRLLNASKVREQLGPDSVFSAATSNMAFDDFRSSLRRKLFEDLHANIALAFKFVLRAVTVEWSCIICADAKGLSWKNVGSLRLHALLHLERHQEEPLFAHLASLLEQEWRLLRAELPTLPMERVRRRQEFPVGRSFLAYAMLRDDDRVGAVMDRIDECCLDGPPKKLRNALCLVCHSPFAVSLLQPLLTPPHFSMDSHRHLAVKGWSEFAEVAEIAELPHAATPDPSACLAFSTFQHLSNEPDAAPCKLFKWRCTLCSLDVALFPSAISLRLFALRHLERTHPTAFNELFYRHEWSLLQMETSLVSMREFSMERHFRELGRAYDITDPSDFVFPWQRALRVPSGFFACGHCFLVSRGPAFVDHLVASHGCVADPGARIVVDDCGGAAASAAAIEERTIRAIRKSLAAPASILFGALSMEDEKEEAVIRLGEAASQQGAELQLQPGRPTTPVNLLPAAASATALIVTPRSSKYSLRARSAGALYVPLTGGKGGGGGERKGGARAREEEEEEDEETMSSEESDSGMEKNYETMSGDEEEEEGEETMIETGDEEVASSALRTAASDERRGSLTAGRKRGGGGGKQNSNTCTESSIACSADLYDNGLGAAAACAAASSAAAAAAEKEEHPSFNRAAPAAVAVHERAFRWEGAEPAQLSAEQIELIRVFKENGRCELCPRTKGYRGVPRMTNVEQSMMAHLIVNHPSHPDASAIVERKRYLLASSLAAGAVVAVPPFLMQSVHPNYLTCSRCLEFKCSRQANLAVHWEACSGVKGNRGGAVNGRARRREEGEEEEQGGKKTTPKRNMHSLRCPLCREGWKKSAHYSDDVSVAIHLLLRHTTQPEAYEMAIAIEEETSMRAVFPFIDMTASFALRVQHPAAAAGIQCARCEVNSPTMAAAIRHATRKHASVAEKQAANFAVGRLSCPLPSSACALRSVVGGHARSIPALHFTHVLFNHRREEEEAAAFMAAIGEDEKAALRDEPHLRVDVDKSLESWLTAGPSCAPRLVCAACARPHRSLAALDKAGCGGGKCGGKKKEEEAEESEEMGSRATPEPAASAARGTTSASSERRGRGRVPERAMPCAHCPRLIYASACYAPSVSMDIHLLKMHPAEAEETMTTAPSVFPFIDFACSSADSLQCALCEYAAREARYMLPHAWTRHTEEAQSAAGLQAWADFQAEAERKRAKQRVSCARPLKRLRAAARRGSEPKEEQEDEDEDDDWLQQDGGGSAAKRAKRADAAAAATATAFIRTPRQRSTVSRWLDTALAATSSYSTPAAERVDDDLRDRLDRLFGLGNTPSTSKETHASSSIFKELPETSLARMAPQGRAEDISHIKGVEGVRCSVCSFKGRDTESLRIHFNEAHQEVSALSAPDVFPCAVCALVFTSKKKWRVHCEEDHRPKERPFQCFKCQFRYETHAKLRAHQIRVHESELHVHPDDRTCRDCNKLFGSLRAYREHRKRHERREREDEGEEEVE